MSNKEIPSQWRAEFEMEWRSQKSYRELDKETALKWFLLGRQTACIELPEPTEDNHFGGWYFDSADLKLSIEKQGYKVREMDEQ